MDQTNIITEIAFFDELEKNATITHQIGKLFMPPKMWVHAGRGKARQHREAYRLTRRALRLNPELGHSEVYGTFLDRIIARDTAKAEKMMSPGMPTWAKIGLGAAAVTGGLYLLGKSKEQSQQQYPYQSQSSPMVQSV